MKQKGPDSPESLLQDVMRAAKQAVSGDEKGAKETLRSVQAKLKEARQGGGAASPKPAGPTRLSLGEIRTDITLQSRVLIREDVRADYAEVLRADPAFDFPEVVAFWDGESHWLADGYHRHGAYGLAGRTAIPVQEGLASRFGGRPVAIRPGPAPTATGESPSRRAP